ncbi:DUF1572 domain-containing protein [Flagellimonas profundi]|uniref:DUF1572 domain-containing protein n=1 Tax=Flagellimonas profundi TaxID=2915620 RepID=A0ABS3FLZ2_9FLAO|nr:DUF1572 domain-containing protein [Allomuricauda profundi]MBO0343496.1 DUF1572 domain-containing protein [Allomuricauda profundi]
MKLSTYLANRLREILLEGKWVLGTNFKDEITDLDWLKASQRLGNSNTIVDLTFHINYYISGVAQVLKGGTLDIRDKHSFEYPPIKSEEDWKQMVNKFCADSKEFIELVEKMSDQELLADFIEEKYGTYMRNLDAMIEHTSYHLGQVVLLKKHLR